MNINRIISKIIFVNHVCLEVNINTRIFNSYSTTEAFPVSKQKRRLQDNSPTNQLVDDVDVES